MARHIGRLTVTGLLQMALVGVAGGDAPPPLLQWPPPYLPERASIQCVGNGTLDESEAALSELLSREPENHDALLALAMVRIDRSDERLSQRLYRWGALRDEGAEYEPAPEPVSYDDFRRAVSEASECRQVLLLLDRIDPSRLTMTIHEAAPPVFDLNADGTLDEFERERTALEETSIIPLKASTAEPHRASAADVHALRSKVHLRLASSEATLAVDFRDFFERSAHLVFPNAVTPYEFLKPPQQEEELEDSGWGFFGFDPWWIVDSAAAISTASFEVVDQERLVAALDQLRHSVDASALAFRDDCWPGMQRLHSEMVHVLNGSKLAPFWRGETGLGVNINRAFREAERINIVLWIQGTDAAPFLEEGEIADLSLPSDRPNADRPLAPEDE